MHTGWLIKHKNEAKKGGDDVGNEHGAIVKSRAEEVFLPTGRALLGHVEGFLKRESARFKQVALVAFGAFQVENAVRFRAFF